jgi:putative redox protein
MNPKVNWISKLYLEGATATGHSVSMDSSAAGAETKGPTPKELLLQALAGCTMMDVVVIMEKSRKHLEKFWVDVDAELADEHPKVFTKIHLTYNFLGEDLDDSTIKRAIDLSREKYCAIYNVLRNQVDITYSYEINKEVNEENLINT